jgi:outer membrane receptor for ferric coprogen and ferric-rhodotorulic acid
MHHPFLLSACALATLALAADARAQADGSAAPAAAPTERIESVVVTGKRANRISKGATGLAMALKDTPQSISTLDREDLTNFGLTGSNEALALATGINVEQWETNRANFNARGFDIQLTQVDGLGMTNSWGTVVGREDSFLFERIELIRGANGLLTGVGNASGTINYIRKRPRNQDGGELEVSLGAWNLKRAAVDYNRVLSADGAWAGRLVAAHEDKDAHVRDQHDRRSSVYGVVDGQIGNDGVLTLGVTAVDARQSSPMWGSLTLRRTDGSQADFDVATSTAQRWTYWNNRSASGFIEYAHRLSSDWEAKLTYSARHGDESTRLLYAYVPGTGLLNPDNTGLIGWPYRSEGSANHRVFDANLSGEFSAWGRRHSLLVGLSRSRETTAVDTFAALTHGSDPLPALPFGGDAYAEPQWGERAPSTRGEQQLTRLYAASRLALTDGLKAIVGLNAVRLERRGASIYGSAATNTDYPDTREVSPYAGLTYDFSRDLLGYVSYSDIFQNQDQTDPQGEYLAPMKGVNTELGLKAEWLDKALLTTAAVFTAEQRGLATYGGIVTGTGTPRDGRSWYEGKDVKSRGFELEATGRLTRDTRLTLGYTQLRLTGPDGNDIYEWAPRRTLNLRLDGRLPTLPALHLGLAARWQSETHKAGGPRQGAYAKVDAFAAYDLNDRATLRLNVFNLADEKAITGISYGALYIPPRHATLSLNYKL